MLFCPDSSEKSHSYSAEQWWKCHHLLSSNLTWGDVSKMVACPAPWWAALFWKTCWGSIFHDLLPQCRSRRCPSRTSSGTHLHSWPFPGCNPTTCRSDLLWWIQPLKQKHLLETNGDFCLQNPGRWGHFCSPVIVHYCLDLCGRWAHYLNA